MGCAEEVRPEPNQPELEAKGCRQSECAASRTIATPGVKVNISNNHYVMYSILNWGIGTVTSVDFVIGLPACFLLIAAAAAGSCTTDLLTNR